MTHGVYTVANDVVYDQLVAFLNSVEVNAGADTPVCVIAYDERTDKIRAEIESRKNVTLLNDPGLFEPWEEFSGRVWKAHPKAMRVWEKQGIKGVYRIGMNRRYALFDPAAPFDKFIYFDADTLVLGPLDFVFERLEQHPFIVYDYQYKDPSHIYNLKSPKLYDVFDESRIRSEIFCAGFYAAQKGLFSNEQRDWLVSRLEEGDAEVLYYSAPNQSVLNYMVMRSGVPVHNLIFHLPEDQRTGNAATSTRFVMRDGTLYEDGKRRLTYIHYIGISSRAFNELCQGVNHGFPYRDVFLHYRYLHEPEKRPVLKGKPKPFGAPPSLMTRALQKVGLVKAK
ncbi:MAG: hypothetical protein SFY66_25350 [Oculatellaceae cyanobacterium bins.114]|nr:hypothetical protein [Oculatellaceae cyanobacterium bins.114]